MRDRNKKYRITILNWHKYQTVMRGERHKEQRGWIALTTNLYRDPDFLSLPVTEKLTWILLLLHAGSMGVQENSGEFGRVWVELSESSARVLFGLKHSPDFSLLRNQGFIELEAATNKTNSTRQTRQDKQSTASATPFDFDELKAVYPKRAGDYGWNKAIRACNARLKEGVEWQQIIDGAKRYAAYCEATDAVGTAYVKQAATFCGPDRHFEQPWNIPKNKQERKQEKNISATEEWLNANT